MRPETAAAARANGGIVPTAHLGANPGRTAGRHGLVPVQPRVLVARTQPVEVDTLLRAAGASVVGDHAFLGRTALWLYGVGPAPDVVEVGVPHRTRYRARPPLIVRRVAPAVLRGARVRQGARVVALEVAVVQTCGQQGAGESLDLVGELLRSRRTSVPGLRSRLRRGLAGSAAVRAALNTLVGTSLDVAVRALRSALAERGVDGLETEVHLRSSSGASAYLDLLDRKSRTAVEVDGFLTHAERSRFRADRRRDRWVVAEHDVLTLRVDALETVEHLSELADELARIVLSRRAAAAA